MHRGVSVRVGVSQLALIYFIIYIYLCLLRIYLYMYLFMYLFTVIHCKGFQLRFWSCRCCNPHQLFSVSLQHTQEVAIVWKLWVLGGIRVALRQIWAKYLYYAHLARPQYTTWSFIKQKTPEKWEDDVNLGEFHRYFFARTSLQMVVEKHRSLLYPDNWVSRSHRFFQEDGEQEERSSPNLTWAAQKPYALVSELLVRRVDMPINREFTI